MIIFPFFLLQDFFKISSLNQDFQPKIKKKRKRKRKEKEKRERKEKKKKRKKSTS